MSSAKAHEQTQILHRGPDKQVRAYIGLPGCTAYLLMVGNFRISQLELALLDMSLSAADRSWRGDRLAFQVVHAHRHSLWDWDAQGCNLRRWAGVGGGHWESTAGADLRENWLAAQVADAQGYCLSNRGTEKQDVMDTMLK